MKKRIVTILLILVWMISLGMVASAQGATLTATPSAVCPGGELTVAIGVEAGSNIAAGDLVLSYDTDTFQYVSYEYDTLLNSAISAGNCDNGVCKLSFAGVEPITQGGTLFTVTFKVDSDATGEHDFYCYATSLVDAAGENIDCDEISFSVEPTGTPVTGTDVVPVTGVDEKGNSYIVMATSSEESIWLSILVVIGVVVAIVVLGGLFVVLVSRAPAKEKQEPEHESILDEESRKFMGISDNAKKK